MKMIAVRGVVVGAQHAIEKAAGSGAHFSEKRGPIVWLGPIFQHANALSVFEFESRDVQRLCRRMLTSSCDRASVDVATRITAEVLDGRNSLLKVLLRGRHEHVVLPHR